MRRLLSFHALLVYLFLYLPILVVVALSFNESRRGVHFTGFTLKWYQGLFQDPRVLEYFANTLVVALVSTLVSTVLGTLLALGLVRYRFPGKGFLRYLLYVPVVVPDVVMGVSLLLLFAFSRELLGFPRLSLLTVILGHITFQVAFVTLVVRSRLLLLDPALEEAARHLQAARGLGLWDMLGGGFLSSLLKHSKMDDAQRAMDRAEQELRAFGRELADVQMYADIQLRFDSFTRFFDTFCDNFFVDWMVQSQILQAQDRVEEARQRVWEAVQQLQFLQGA